MIFFRTFIGIHWTIETQIQTFFARLHIQLQLLSIVRFVHPIDSGQSIPIPFLKKTFESKYK